MRAALAAALLAAAPAPALPPGLPQPGPPLPGAVVTCDVTADELTANCESPTTSDPAADRALAEGLAAHPLRLPGALAGPGLRVEVLRAEIGRGRPTPPAWDGALYKPTGRPVADDPAALARYYPDRALRMNIQGRSLVRCRVTDDGRLNECWSRSETPPDTGFAAAGLHVASLLHVPPPEGAAPPYAQRVADIPIAWGIPREALPIEAPK